MRGVLEARRSARINARACDARMAALAGVVVLHSKLARVALQCGCSTGALLASVT